MTPGQGRERCWKCEGEGTIDILCLSRCDACDGRGTLPICPDSGDDVDDCHCVDVRDYDERDAADECFQQELDERGGE